MHLCGVKKIWDVLHNEDEDFTIANLFWWFNMYSSVDISVTPRPMYLADGRKIPDIWTAPSDLRKSLQSKFGQFPLFNFWGPTAGIASSQWIADAAMEVDKLHAPTLSFIYLPHLDYPMQLVGPNHESIPGELRAIDAVTGQLLEYYSQHDVEVCILSEYGIEEVQDAVAINRVLRTNDFLAIREECGKEYLDAGASDAFAVPDHQVAHVYVKNPMQIDAVKTLLENTEGIEFVLAGDDRKELAHERCGEIVAVSSANRWISHDWWTSDAKAPDYQGTVDIHRKPGYDPRELVLASGWRGSAPRIALKLLAKKLGFRTLFDVVTLDVTKVHGSHGRTPEMGAPSPILIAPKCAKKMPQSLPVGALKDLIVSWVTSS